MVLSTLCYAFVPLVIELTSDSSNPFFFNSIAIASTVVVQFIFLRATVTPAFGGSHTISTVLSQISGMPRGDAKAGIANVIRSLARVLFGPATRVSPSESYHSSTFLKRSSAAIRLPFLWAVFGWFQFGLYIWATRYVEVAVSAVIYELWVIVMVLVLAKVSVTSADKGSQSNESDNSSTEYRRLDYRRLLLMAAAFVGLALVILGQSDTSLSAFQSFLGNQSIGIVLALLSAGATAALGVAGFVSGDRLYDYYHAKASGTPALNDTTNADSASAIANEQSDLQKLWFIFLLLSSSAIAAIPMHFIFGVADKFNPVAITPVAILGAAILGLLSVLGSILWRLANVITTDLAINTITYLTPVFGLGLLTFVGITLPRVDLFWMGAILVFAINVLIHLSPDEEGEYELYGTSRPRGSRLGFTSLIMALWAFGSVIYLRDEALPSSLLHWDTSEYWALVALAATVFALILGFRVARLTSRLNSEDEAMIELFRRCEYLVRIGALSDDTLQKLRAFDTAEPKQHSAAYDAVRTRFAEARALCVHSPDLLDESGSNVEAEIFELQLKFDKLAHSKQQGRDFAELISICLVALITVMLGLFARPRELMLASSGWSGFMTELFSTIFVSIVAFLSFNLLDMRRDREIPLIVEMPGAFRQFGLFFRHKRNIAIAQTVSVIIVVAMVVLFAALLHDKWI